MTTETEVDPLIGRNIDGYQIEKLLGKGGMARVYRAQDVRLGRYAAIKVIEPDARADPEYARRFEKEARAVAHLQHQHIVNIYRFGEVDGLYYMAMQYVEGADLSWTLLRYAKDGQVMPLDDVLRVVTQIASALDYAHSRGVIHRDFKPSNVMVDNDGQAFLTDFGLALVLIEGTHGEIFGTPQYIAPEQAISSAGAVPQSDQYSLGVMLYEMLTGSVPYDGKSAMAIAMAHMTEPLPPPLERNPDMNPAFVEILEKALQKEPQNRYPNCMALVADLERVIKGQGQRPMSPRVSMLSISQQVKDFRAAHPLPPLPAPVARATATSEVVAAVPSTVSAPKRPPAPPSSEPMQPSSQVSPVAQSTLSKPTVAKQVDTRQTWMWIAGASGVVVVIGLIAIALLLNSKNSNASLTPTVSLDAGLSNPTSVTTEIPVSTPVPAVIASEVPVLTSTPEPLVPTDAPTVAAVAVVPTQTEYPTLEPISFVLNVISNGEDSLLVVNLSVATMPLTLLALGDGDAVVDGEDWNMPMLKNSECVGIWKDEGKPKDPPITCTQVGERLTRKGKDRFWKDAFNVYYNDVLVKTCEKQETESGCIVVFTFP